MFSGERMHGEVIEGDLIYDHEIMQHYIIQYETNTHHAIKAETLKMSLDNGETWHTMEQLKALLSTEDREEVYNRTAIVYSMNGLYNLLRYDGEILFTGNKQSCEFEKDKWDIRYKCGWPVQEQDK